MPQFHAEGKPQTLSEWGQLDLSGGVLSLANDVTAYELNSPLFSDYAHKLRTVWIPGEKAASYDAEDVFDFPVGTVITKTFYYPAKDGAVLKVAPANFVYDPKINLSQARLIETRVLARRIEGWTALPYVWNSEQTEATLKRTGDIQKLTLLSGAAAQDFAYVVPNENQCAGCHATNNTTREIKPIGPKARHLDMRVTADMGKTDQLSYWQSKNLLGAIEQTHTANVKWSDKNADLSARARAYLDINCSHCHSETGPADTSGLHLTPDTPIGSHLGLCKTPIAAGTGTGDRRFGIVPGQPEESIFIYRMDSENPAVMMPELGRSLVHTEGVALIKQWITQIEGSCG